MKWRFMNPYCVYRSAPPKMPTISGCQLVSSTNFSTYPLVCARGFIGVFPSGQADREESRGHAFESFVISLGEVPDVLFVLAHVDRSSDDHGLVPVERETAGEFLGI